METKQYDRKKALEYAKKWAKGRNPDYYDFEKLGGDCTNFISQCLFAGFGTMNYYKYGWYYKSLNSRSASWAGVEFLYRFLANNRGPGPKGKSADIKELVPGDIIQLNLNGVSFSHSLIVLQTNGTPQGTFVATHSYDTYGKRLSEYVYINARFIKIFD
jgi:hypothetical protein